MIKIAILASEFYPPYGGVGIYTQQLVKGLSKNYEVHVFTVERCPKKEVLDFFDNKIKLHYICKANDDFIYNIKFQIGLFFKFMKYHKKYNYDIIHSMNLVHMPDIFLKFRLKKTVIVTAHTSIWGQVNGFLKSNKNFFKMAHSEKGSIITFPVIAFLEWIYLLKTKYMITSSNRFVDYFRKRGYKKELVAIHNGIDKNIFNYSKVQAHPVEKKKGLKILFAGRLITQKGIEIFVKMMSSLKDEKVHFVIAGKGGVEQFKQLLKDYDIPNSKISFLGFIQNHKLPTVYKASDIFVLPSFYENFPISLLEAMSMKCACISTGVGAVDEIIDSSTGFIVKAGDATAFTKKVLKLIKDKDLREKFANNGYNKVINNFTTDKMVKKTIEVYNGMIK